MPPGGIITNAADLHQGACWLASVEPRFAEIMPRISPLPLRLKPPGFHALLEIIVSQQVSVASADAIRARMVKAGLDNEAAVIEAGEAGLRTAGLSGPKIRYALALADAGIDYDALRLLTDAQTIERLTQVPGIGPWTAQIYVMFCMGRPDMFPPGDLALQEAAKVLFDLPTRPTSQVLEKMSLAWSPWRSVAARALFAYYRIVKQRDGLG